MFTVVLRKGYGLGAQAMAGGSFHAPFFIVSWPTGEFGGMGLEGAVRLGYRKELEAEPTPEASEALFKKMVAQSYARGKAINMAAYLEIDDVIDPADTRRWIMRGLKSLPPRASGQRRELSSIRGDQPAACARQRGTRRARRRGPGCRKPDRTRSTGPVASRPSPA